MRVVWNPSPWARRLGAAGLAALAVGLGLSSLRPPESAWPGVRVAARDLPAGTVLGARDVRVVRVPPDAVPSGALSSVAGQVLAAPVRRGEALTDARVRSARGLLVGQPPGLVAAPVRVADADTVDLVQPGDRVDLLATGSPSADPYAPTTGPDPPETRRPPAETPRSQPRPQPRNHPAGATETSIGRPRDAGVAVRIRGEAARVVARGVRVLVVPGRKGGTYAGSSGGAVIVVAVSREDAAVLAVTVGNLALTVSGRW